MIYTSLQIILKLNLLMLTSILVLLSVQIAVLRKIKFKVSRNILENIYMTFIRPLLEYSCEVWDSCAVAGAGRLNLKLLESSQVMQVCLLYMQNPGMRNLIPDAKSESCHFFII